MDQVHDTGHGSAARVNSANLCGHFCLNGLKPREASVGTWIGSCLELCGFHHFLFRNGLSRGFSGTVAHFYPGSEDGHILT